jgi:hypothetical protein
MINHVLSYLQYSPPFYRAMWIASGMDAGFATAMSIRPKFLRDIASILFSVYYIVYANEADEKVQCIPVRGTLVMSNCDICKSYDDSVPCLQSRCFEQHGKRVPIP